MSNVSGRPASSEYAPYYETYIGKVSGDDIVTELRNQLYQTTLFLNSLSEEQANHRYAPDKWSIKELVGHINDTERIFAYRALRFARNDQTPIEGYEQDDYVKNSQFDNYQFADLVEEFKNLRQANLVLFSNLADEAWSRTGKANNKEISVRALAYIIAGHELHHIGVLREKYLPNEE